MNDRKESFIGDTEGGESHLLACLDWFKGLEILASLFLVGRLVTKTC